MQGKRRRAFQIWKRCVGSLSDVGRGARLRFASCIVGGHIPKDRADWTWAELLESCPGRAQVVWFHCLHRRDPSTWAGLPASDLALSATAVLEERHAHGLWTVFFRAPVPSGCTLTEVESRQKASILMRTICSCCNFSKTLSRTPALDQRFMRV